MNISRKFFKKAQTKNKEETFLFKNFDGNNLEKAINLLIYGVEAIKFFENNKKTEQFFLYIKEDNLSLLQCINFSKKTSKKLKIDLTTINNINECSLAISSKVSAKKNSLCIIYNANKKKLLFDFFDKERKKIFWEGIQYFFQQAKSREKKLKFKTFSHEWVNFIQEDKKFTLNEIKTQFTIQNIEFNKKNLKYKFKEIISQIQTKDMRDQTIPFNLFKKMMMDFSLKYEVQNVFIAYCKKSEEAIIKWDQRSLTNNSFREFLKEEQKELIENYLIPIDQSFSFFEFCQYLFHPTNSIFDPIQTSLHQNMNLPLYEYFVNSSHNTYLLGNQLTGESTIQAYVNSFNKGCRCVEIDCWDGPKNTPMVTHGNTLTSKITFESVIKCINEYGFKNNPYPIVLSIENHCSLTQQDRMVEIMEKNFDKKIWKPEINDKFIYPSPNDLKYKILIKCKGLQINEPKSEDFDFKLKINKLLQSQIKISNENIIDEDDENRHSFFSIPVLHTKFENWVQTRFTQNKNNTTLIKSNIECEILKNQPKEVAKGTQKNNAILKSLNTTEILLIDESQDKSNNNQIPYQHEIVKVNIPDIQTVYEIDDEKNLIPQYFSPKEKVFSNREKKSKTINFLSFLISPKHSKKPNQIPSKPSTPVNNSKNTNNISLKLHESLALFSYKLKSFEDQVKFYEIASLSEKKLNEFLTKDYKNIVEVTKKSFMRLYPKASRVDSSNYDSISGFICGIQFIALNFQTNDINLGVYLSYFQQNGNIYSGYVLKPDILRNQIKDERFSRVSYKNSTYIKSTSSLFSPTLIKKNVSNFSDTKTDLIFLPTLEIKLDLLSGFQIFNDNGKLLKEPFFIEIAIKGFPDDENYNKKFISDNIENNFHPIFEDIHLSYSFIFPEMAFLVFTVYKKSQSSKPIAFYSIPVKCIREGYRIVPLMKLKEQQEIKGSCLFCKISIRNLEKYKLL